MVNIQLILTNRYVVYTEIVERISNQLLININQFKITAIENDSLLSTTEKENRKRMCLYGLGRSMGKWILIRRIIMLSFLTLSLNFRL